jgi:hypothetical protein
MVNGMEKLEKRESAVLPMYYYHDSLHLMVRDCCTLYAYWELSSRKRALLSRHFQCDWQFMPHILRVYDVTLQYFHGNNANRQFDIELDANAAEAWIYGLSPATTYVADFGTYTLERQFVPVLRSNFVETPRNTPAQWGEPLVPVFRPEVKEGRTMPKMFENFMSYAAYCAKGVYVDDRPLPHESELHRVSHPGPALPSALYPAQRT